MASGYGTLNLNGGLTTNAYTTLAFNLNLSTRSAAANGEPIYGGDLINLGGSSLTVWGGSITLTPDDRGDWRLSAVRGTSFGSPEFERFHLPPAPSGDICFAEHHGRHGLSGPGRGQCRDVLRFGHLGIQRQQHDLEQLRQLGRQ